MIETNNKLTMRDKMKRRIPCSKWALLASMSLMACAGTSVPSPDEAASALQGVAPLLVNSQHTLTSTADGLAMVAGGSRISLPRSAGDWAGGHMMPRVRVKDAGGTEAVQVNANTALYVGTSTAVSTAVSVALRDDQSVIEYSTILHDPSAAREHAFQVELRDGEQLVSDDAHRAHIEDASGTLIALVEAPWAKDAAGADVAFSMSVRGDNLVMDVPHRDHGYTYPIVVDPSFTIDCGIINCSVYWSRSTTRDIANFGWSGLPFCALGGPAAVACAVGFSLLIGKAAECVGKHQCLRMRYLVTSQFSGAFCDGGRFCHD